MSFDRPSSEMIEATMPSAHPKTRAVSDDK